MLVAAARHCPHHLAVSLWRRKSLLAAATLIASALLICLQYGGLTPLSSDREERPTFDEANSSHKTLIPRRNLSALQGVLVNPDLAGPNFLATAHSKENRVGRYEDTNEKPPRYQHLANDGGQRSGASNTDQNRPQVYDGGRPQPAAVWHDGQLQQNRLWQYQQQSDSDTAKGGSNGYYIPPLRVVHFDLKGAPPKVSYFKQLFPILKEAGANAILLEYEDMFPFSGVLAPIAAKNAYTPEDVRTILTAAKAHRFEVIPLVQTFGHLEFALKVPEFRSLREVDDFPQAICPSRNDSFALVEAIIDQVMSSHKGIRWLHIGCDEVYHLGYCPRCMRQDRDSLFLSHVVRVAQYVRDKYKVTPIVWDDMLRQMPTERLKEFGLGELIEPMVWTYVKDVYRFVPYNIWLAYGEVFPAIWAASAFKGAFGETLTVPDARMHLENNEAWLEVMAEQRKRFTHFRGIVATGWQRYDHLAALCELLPAALPSLVIDLLTLSQGHFSPQLYTRFHRVLQCTTSHPPRGGSDLEADPHLWQRASGCFFPGSAVFRLTQHHADAIKRVDDYLYDVTVHKAWLTAYNVRHNLTSPMRVDEGLADYSAVYYPLTALVRTARDALREVYDEFTVAEWIEQNIYPYLVRMEKLWKDASDLKKKKVWPRRPLPPLDALKKFSIGTGDEGSVEDVAGGRMR